MPRKQPRRSTKSDVQKVLLPVPPRTLSHRLFNAAFFAITSPHITLEQALKLQRKGSKR